jgi:hypothetical protein
MSYDLRLWTVEPVPADAIQKLLPNARIFDGGVEFAGMGWLASIGYSISVELEDIPDHVGAAIPGITSLIEVIIQPISAPDDAMDAVEEALKTLAKQFRGAVEDLQTDTLVLPSGPLRIRSSAQIDSRLSTLDFNYWFTESPLRTREGRGRLIDYLAEQLPAALPRRYGLYEPPSEKWEIGGRAAFLDFLDGHPPDELTVIYPTRPCVHFIISPVEVGWAGSGTHRIFKCGCLKTAFEFTVLEDAEWRTALERAWLDIATIVQPFATNVEVVDGWIFDRGHLWIDEHTEASVCSPAWFGVPRNLGLAFGLAKNYLQYWPQLRTRSASADGLAYVNAGDWRSRRGVSEIIGEAPSAIRERPGRGRTVGFKGAVSYKPVPKGYPCVFFFPMPHRPWAAFAAWVYARFSDS